MIHDSYWIKLLTGNLFGIFVDFLAKPIQGFLKAFGNWKICWNQLILYRWLEVEIIIDVTALLVPLSLSINALVIFSSEMFSRTWRIYPVLHGERTKSHFAIFATVKSQILALNASAIDASAQLVLLRVYSCVYHPKRRYFIPTPWIELSFVRIAVFIYNPVRWKNIEMLIFSCNGKSYKDMLIINSLIRGIENWVIILRLPLGTHTGSHCLDIVI